MSTTHLRLAAKVRVPRRVAVAPSGNQRRGARGHDPQSIWGHARSRSHIRATTGAGQPEARQGCPIGGSP